MVWNSLTQTSSLHFDVAPFILLNLILSFTAAFQAPFIIMSQNRQAIRDKHEAVVDFSINYKAELEIDNVQKHLRHLELQVADIHQMLHKLHSKQTEKQNPWKRQSQSTIAFVVREKSYGLKNYLEGLVDWLRVVCEDNL